MNKIIMFLLTCMLLALSAGCTQKDTKETKESMAITNVSAEQVVRDHFKYWNEKDLKNLEKTMVPARKGITWELNKLESVRLISIKEKEAHAKDKKEFEVVFEIKYKGGYGSGLINGKYTWSFMLEQNDSNSQWLIRDWGV